MIRKTALIKNDKFSKYSQNNVYLKTENLQTTGSFKIRALYDKVDKLAADGIKQVVVASTGNTAKSVAYLASKYNMDCYVYLPVNTPYNIIKEVKDLDAIITLEGSTYEETVELASKYAQDNNYEFINLYHDLDASIAYGSLVKEIVEDLPETDIILVPVGTGSLLNGVVTYIKEHDLKIDVYAVEPYNSASLCHSIEANEPIKINDNYSIAKTIDIKKVSKTFFDNVKDFIKGVIKVGDEELIDCFLDVIEENKIIVENAGLLSLAGAKYLSEKSKNVVCLLTGGNIDITTISSLVEYALAHKGRIFTFKSKLNEKPGQLRDLFEIIAQNDGNVIGLKHDQLSNITRQDTVDLIVSIETFGLAHKFKICKALDDYGYDIELIEDQMTSDIYV